MARTHGRAALAPGLALAGLILAPAPGAFALDPSLQVSQYAHTAWTIRDGFYKGTIHAIAQTADGYLWLGTEFGLVRFDGVRMVPWRPPGNEQLPHGPIQCLLSSRDGRLWIGTYGGLASWSDGKLTQYPELAGQEVRTLLEDRGGTVWVGVAAIPNGRLCEVHGGSVRCYEEDGRFGHEVTSLYQDSAGSLWVGAEAGLWRWHPGPPRLFPMPRRVISLSERDSGALLISMRIGVRTLVGGRAEVYPLPGSWIPDHLFRDRDGGLWVVMQTGLLHVHEGRMDVFTPSDGLSGPNVSALFEDREGNIWVATTDGLDRFRAQAVVPISAKQGLPDANHVSAVLGARDGSVWVGNFAGLTRWDRGQVTIYRHKGSTQARELVEKGGLVHDVADSGLPSGGAQSLFQDERGRIWVATPGGIAYLEDGRFARVKGVPGGASTMAEDRASNLWISNPAGLFRLRDESVVEKVSWVSLGRKDFASSLTADPVHGGLWLGFSKGGVAYFKDAQIVASYTDLDGLGKGRVNGFRVDTNGALWAATEGGLSRIEEGRITTLTSQSGLPCNNVDWAMEDDERSFWLNMDCALVRIPREALDSWVEDPRRTVHTTVFDSSDGVRSHAFYGHGSPRVGTSADGRIWFSTWDGLGVIDPRRLPVNELPPPVHVEKIIVDDQAHDVSPGLRLPPHSNQVEIDYTALSFVAPEKVRFRFRLEGRDRDWQEPVTRRQAFYNDLPPGGYRFRVIACNNSGMWNEDGASLDFTIAPAYYQTIPFRALAAAALLGLLWAAYRVRVRVVERHSAEISAFNEQLMKAQEQERTRLAGELHDSVMQQIAALNLVLGTAKRKIAADSEAKEMVADVQRKLIDVGTEVRQLSHDLHPPELKQMGLPEVLHGYCDSFSQAHGIPVSCEVEASVADLSEGAGIALYRIAQEALGNAAKHAAPTRVEVRLARAGPDVVLTIADDGRGRDPGQVDRGGLGLVNMRERARQLGGTFELDSRPGHGTTVRVAVPFRIREAKPPSVR